MRLISPYYKELTIMLLVLFIAMALACKGKKHPNSLFDKVPSSLTNIVFSNDLHPTDSLNILDYNYYYNGGGVAAADFNNDGLTDLYFTGNQVSSQLYLNRGNFAFTDITTKSGVGTSNWATGIAVSDVNNDGLQDMYVSYAGYTNPVKRKHQLFINKGIDKEGVPHFADEAPAYGLDDTSYTTQSAFFDFDKDGDLDLLLINHYQDYTNPNYPLPKVKNGASPTNARFYRNDSTTFKEISKSAGLLEDGYALGVNVCDINGDGWTDIYISKDFIYDDALYINNRNGTFSESINKYLRHTSQFSMGCDIADYNNDTYPDIFTLDMLPYDNKRQKLMNIATNKEKFNYTLALGYMPQYSRNMLQLSNGADVDGNYCFSEIAQLAGVDKTDWSWSPLFADFDNDGLKDLFISNGIPKDITNNDFVSYRDEEIVNNSKEEFSVLKNKMLKQIEKLEPVKKNNFIFKNKGDLTFSDETFKWGFDKKGFSTGAAYVDLDNDGDLDIVTNNINDKPSVFNNRNNTMNGNQFIRIKLKGKYSGGAKITIGHNGKTQFREHSVCHGFQSSQEDVTHFGLGTDSIVNTIKVVWLDGKVQMLNNTRAGQLLVLEYNDSMNVEIDDAPLKIGAPLFKDITYSTGINLVHKRNLFDDFNYEPLLPHRFSMNGPYTATADVDNNGFEDIWIGGPAKLPGKLLLQQANGTFVQKDMPDPGYEDMGGVFFDADGDKDADLYIVSGGNMYNPFTATYQDRLYLNDGKGNFRISKESVPTEYSSGSIAIANDFDKDGDADLFAGGRVVPTRYPLPPQSFLFVNDGKGRFTDATATVCKELSDMGMITTALWSDFDNDGWTDLIVAGEWMPVAFFKNQKGALVRMNNIALNATTGWWFSLAAGDFDKDGDTDYIAGNLGLNNKFHPSADKPLSVYTKDFDGNGTMEPILSYFLNDKEYTVANRDQITSVMPSIKKKFDTYTKFAEAGFNQIFSKAELEDAFKLKATSFASCYIENVGNGNFNMRPLPVSAQFSTLQCMQSVDIDHDGNLDLLAAGNFYSPDFMIGRYDASNGLVLRGDGKGNFSPLPPSTTGLLIGGDVRCFSLLTIKNKKAIATAVNEGKLSIHQQN